MLRVDRLQRKARARNRGSTPGLGGRGSSAYLLLMSDTPQPTPAEARRQFRRTLARVLIVQIITVLLLWLLQATYSG